MVVNKKIMEVYILELISQEDNTGVEFKETLGVFDSKIKALDLMKSEAEGRDIILTKDVLDIYDCDKPFVLDSSFFIISNYVVE